MRGPSCEVCVRSYQPADWPRLCVIHDLARMDELRLSVGEDAFRSLQETYQEEGLFDGEVLVASLEDTIAGFVAVSENEVTWLYVDPSLYRRGVGRALLRAAFTHCDAAIRIELLEGNTAAERLYASEGFRIVERREGRLVGNEAFVARGLLFERPHSF